MFVLRFVVAVRLADPGGLLTWHTVAGLASWMCVCVAIYVLNGISDVDGDRCNQSSRPIASGRMGVAAAWQAILWLMLAGLTLAALVSAGLVVAFVGMSAVGWAYSLGAHPLKNSLPGLVASGTALGMLTYAAGWLAAGGGLPGPDLIVLAVGMSLWMGLAGTATKDLKDVSGDRLAGRRTLPVLLGTQRAAMIAGVAAIGHGTVFLLVVRLFAPGLTMPAIGVLTGGICVAVVAWHTAKSSAGRSAYRAYMVTQYGVNLLALI